MDKISITICGDGGCGKSSITLRLVHSQWIHEYDPTIEDSYSVTRNVDGLPYFLSITDTAGQEEYRGLWTASTLKSDAFLLVYDITNPSSLETLDYFMDMINMEAEQRVEDNERLRKELGPQAARAQIGMPPPVKILAGNKCDLKDDRAVTSRDGLEYARKHGCGFMETSAREMVNIEETFSHLVRRVVEARRVHCQQDTPRPPQCTEPAHTTALPRTSVDATVDGRTRSRVWRFIKRRKTTEPYEQVQEQNAMARTEKQTRKHCLCCFR
ncbi:ras small monomeric GTPase [Penicillium canescens]|uniref:Ras small monomeric GTPase n=1 Tax=Penicillium canescens TaxID=5083 RepID=A0AAD6I1F6_PENCN|nr:ras small monomeric GTPase [Penicillium canescens]KAJ6026737.1 ras small monomeric GTPase [Penicillium canescens]KAJ6067624.1 ras small monomeric GTPase [Penicillium canescens]KAJ6085207.1 ras small monomeric GTPase [Penicillium canescens]KAJ6161988.1 ras small monomeric GTPase [Penicillium canescens]